MATRWNLSKVANPWHPMRGMRRSSHRASTIADKGTDLRPDLQSSRLVWASKVTIIVLGGRVA
jgi:hypothetical protein